MNEEKIRVCRFCSRRELDRYLRGELLVSRDVHDGFNTCSRGFCFAPEEPRKAWRYLKGIVSHECCMVLEFDRRKLKESYGNYVDYDRADANPDLSLLDCCTRKLEYCTPYYSRRSSRLLEVLKPEEFATPEDIELLNRMKRYATL